MMKEPYLEITFRHGVAFAAYLYLPRQPGEKSVRTRKFDPGMVVDFGTSGRPIGIEITAPAQVTPEALNRVLGELGISPMTEADLAPLLAA
jgi:uncharacterized protein YuzE